MNMFAALLFFFITTVSLLFVVLVIWHQVQLSKRRNFIRHYKFPPGLFEKLKREHASLQPRDYALVTQALRQFFLAYLKSGKKNVAMPSRVADDLWHEFILYTKQYQDFCDRAFGAFLHHTPAAVMGKTKDDNTGLRRVWWYVCKEDNINPNKPLRMPLLFAVDGKLGVQRGHVYSLVAMAGLGQLQQKENDSVHNGSGCGSSSDVSIFSDKSVDGTTDGFGDSGGGDGGDGGSSCGGGCGGD
jgi:hypothetical protein